MNPNVDEYDPGEQNWGETITILIVSLRNKALGMLQEAATVTVVRCKIDR